MLSPTPVCFDAKFKMEDAHRHFSALMADVGDRPDAGDHVEFNHYGLCIY